MRFFSMQQTSERRVFRALISSVLLGLGFFSLGVAPAWSASSCAPATSAGRAGIYYKTLCWLDFTGYNDAVAAGAGQPFAFTLPDGSALSMTLQRGGNNTIAAVASPSLSTASIGGTGGSYLGIPGRPVLYTNNLAIQTVTVTASSIALQLPSGTFSNSFPLLAADGEFTDQKLPGSGTYRVDSLRFQSNAPVWSLFQTLPGNDGSMANLPALAGIGTSDVSETGSNTASVTYVGSYIVSAAAPSQVISTLSTGNQTSRAQQGFLLALNGASVTLNKQVNGRVDSRDQFVYQIQNSAAAVLNQATTSGASTGLMTAVGSLSFGGALTLSEVMAPGSASTLSQYTSSISCSNATGGSATVLPTGAGTMFSLTPQPGDDIACVLTNTPIQPSQVAISKTANVTTLVPGGTIIYTVNVRNTGTTPANGTQVNDPLPAGITASSWTCSASGGAACPVASGVGALTQTLAVFPAGGMVTYTINATVAGTPPASITNVATAVPPAGGLCAPADSPPPCMDQVSVPPTPQVSIVKNTTTQTAVPGGSAAYTVTVGNVGAVSAAGTIVSDPIPAGLSAYSWTCSATGGALCPNASGAGAIIETIMTLPPGGAVIYAITATVSTPLSVASIANVATVTPPAGGSCTPCSDQSVLPAVAQVDISKTASVSSVSPGGTVTYTVTATNTGSVSASGTVLSDPLPLGVDATDWMCVGSGGADCPNASGRDALNETVTTFPPGGRLVYTVVATLSSSAVGNVVNTAVLTPASGGVCTASCSATATVTVVPVAAASIPTLGKEGLLLLSLLLGGLSVGVFRLRVR